MGHRDMGLYDDRLADLSEPRARRVAQRRTSVNPGARRRVAISGSPTATERRSSANVQSLLFDRNSGWTIVKAKAWAKTHGYQYGKVDATDQYVRVRQSDPGGSAVKRTIPFGRGIRAVVAREGVSNSMATTRKSRRKKSPRRAAKKRAAPRKKRAHKRASAKKGKKSKARAAAEAPRPRRRRRRAAPAGMVMEAKRKPRKRRAKRKTVEAWRGDSAGHKKAAKKGWRRKKAKKAKRRTSTRKKSRVNKESVAAPRRRRSSSRRRSASYTMEASRRPRRRRHTMNAKRGQRGSQIAQMSMALVTGGLGFVLADGLDRWLATYNPTAAEKPKDKFTSDGAGTLANTLNVASRPGLVRLGAGVGVTALPAIAAVYAEHPMLRASLEGAALGAGISLFKMVWNNYVMPMLKPKDTSTVSLQKSFIARLYPAEVAAAINIEQKTTAGALSGAGETGVGDVGPFALQGDSPYADAAQALRREAGMQGVDGPGSDYPTQQNVWGTGDQYPTAAQAMGTGELGALFSKVPMSQRAAVQHAANAAAKAVVLKCVTQSGLQDEPGVGVPDAYMPGPPPGPGPGPQGSADDKACGCIGENNPFLGFVGDTGEPSDSGMLMNI